jgi:hypothetical protein
MTEGMRFGFAVEFLNYITILYVTLGSLSQRFKFYCFVFLHLSTPVCVTLFHETYLNNLKFDSTTIFFFYFGHFLSTCKTYCLLDVCSTVCLMPD